MELSDDVLQAYLDKHSTAENEVLQELRRETYLKVLSPHMLSGPLQGQLLAMFVHMLQAKNILEIGTFTGYTALWMAEALPEDGILHTIDINEELEELVRTYIDKAKLSRKIQYHLGNALDIIPTLDVTFDLVFIDANKASYRHYYEMALAKVRKNGFIVADNVLWKGKVVTEDGAKKSRHTAVMQEFNELVHNDPRVANVLLPVRDGLMVIRKR